MPLSNNKIRGIVVSVVGISVLFIYFWRRKPVKYYTREEFFREFHLGVDSNFNHHEERSKSTQVANVAVGRSDITGTSLSSRNSYRKETETDTATIESVEGLNYGKLGLKSLDEVIRNLESCIFKLNKFDEEHQHVLDQIPPTDSRLLFNDLQSLLENAYMMRNKYKQRLIFTDHSYVGSDESVGSSNESFVSAMEYHIDENIENIIEASDREKRFLYKSALVELENGNIYYRSKRTELVKCQNDTDFITKMYCLRLASRVISSSLEMSKELEEIGFSIGTTMLQLLDYETDPFQIAYRKMMKFLQQANANTIIKEELSDKGVEVVSLYDVLFDFLLFDALEVLENPPSSLVSVINNRWLSEGFKKTALSSSVWTILLAKRKFLQHKSGFKAHLYDMLESSGAPLAWAFLGKDERGNRLAGCVRDQLMGLVTFMFSDAPRFTRAEELAEDVLVRLRAAHRDLLSELQLLQTPGSRLDDSASIGSESA